MERLDVLRSMMSRVEAALLELQAVAHDGRSTGLVLQDLYEITESLIHVRDTLAELAASVARTGPKS